MNFYQFRLDADNDFWSKCTTRRPNATETARSTSPGTAPATTRASGATIPGSTAQYTIELVPAGHGDPVRRGRRRVDDRPADGTFRIRVTGRPSPTSKLRRTINATFRRDSFLDFLYFTDYETLDPAAYGSRQHAGRRRTARSAAPTATRTASRSSSADFDRINGPFHTNDDILTCGNPIFGRSARTRSRSRARRPAGSATAGCSGSPEFKGPFTAGTQELTMPPTNASSQTVGRRGLHRSRARRRSASTAGGGMTVTQPVQERRRGAEPWRCPPNGVIYVKNGGTSGTRVPRQHLAARRDLRRGPPAARRSTSAAPTRSNVTIGSQKDIIIRAARQHDNGDLVRANDNVVLGLIAEQLRARRPPGQRLATTSPRARTARCRR